MQTTKEPLSKQSAYASSTRVSEYKIQVLRNRFFARTDECAISAPWNKPCRVQLDDHDAAILAHVSGATVPEATFTYDRDGRPETISGHLRLGTYCLAPDNTVVWLCGDLDGLSHGKNGLANADEIALRIMAKA